MSAVYIDPAILWDRVASRIVVTESGCWEWQGAVTSRGYGCIGAGRKGKTITTHRLAALVRDGSLSDGLTVDHLCHNSSDCTETGKACRHRRCVNPDHLDVCDGGLNTRRARRRGHYCSRGHEVHIEVVEGADFYRRGCECGVTELPLPDWFPRPLARTG